MLLTKKLVPAFYERAIRTKGRDHMQEHVIPISLDNISQAVAIFTKVATDVNLVFHEIQVIVISSYLVSERYQWGIHHYMI